MIVRPAIVSGTDRDEVRVAERTGVVVGDALLGALKRFGVKVHPRSIERVLGRSKKKRSGGK